MPALAFVLLKSIFVQSLFELYGYDNHIYDLVIGHNCTVLPYKALLKSQ